MQYLNRLNSKYRKFNTKFVFVYNLGLLLILLVVHFSVVFSYFVVVVVVNIHLPARNPFGLCIIVFVVVCLLLFVGIIPYELVRNGQNKTSRSVQRIPLSLFIVFYAYIQYLQYKFDSALWTLSLLIEILILPLNSHTSTFLSLSDYWVCFCCSCFRFIHALVILMRSNYAPCAVPINPRSVILQSNTACVCYMLCLPVFLI